MSDHKRPRETAQTGETPASKKARASGKAYLTMSGLEDWVKQWNTTTEHNAYNMVVRCIALLRQNPDLVDHREDTGHVLVRQRLSAHATEAGRPPHLHLHIHIHLHRTSLASPPPLTLPLTPPCAPAPLAARTWARARARRP
jgi:hypothetical protein